MMSDSIPVIPEYWSPYVYIAQAADMNHAFSAELICWRIAFGGKFKPAIPPYFRDASGRHVEYSHAALS